MTWDELEVKIKEMSLRDLLDKIYCLESMLRADNISQIEIVLAGYIYDELDNRNINLKRIIPITIKREV